MNAVPGFFRREGEIQLATNDSPPPHRLHEVAPLRPSAPHAELDASAPGSRSDLLVPPCDLPP